jgi:hypothetical protein
MLSESQMFTTETWKTSVTVFYLNRNMINTSKTLVSFYEMTRRSIPEDFFEVYDDDNRMAPTTAWIDSQ